MNADPDPQPCENFAEQKDIPVGGVALEGEGPQVVTQQFQLLRVIVYSHRRPEHRTSVQMYCYSIYCNQCFGSKCIDF